jgi:hypothetical protein
MKSALIDMKLTIEYVMKDLKAKKERGNLSVNECMQEIGYLKIRCEELIREYK